MRHAALLLLLLAAAGCGRTAKAAQGVDDLLDASPNVEAFRIIPPDPPAPPAGDFLGWREVGGAVPVPASTAAAFAALLKDPASYQDAPKPCVPVPGLKLRYAKGAARADVVFCFECLMLFTYRDGQPLGGGDFDPSARAFARLFKPLFPKDAVVQGLKE